ncbi:SH3 domain-binding glutamic acid-rich protein-like [Dreissena polymorpha]|uniref:SH3 domain-binding glutamic acid-rich protein-like n=1 Tax=Dreissena polymorpha TaxID=45954 RepID=UPI0022651FF7|nr:SH3 domain-binding glutamic acid-rich protein-like [Dreissena polymorpha]
MRKHQQHIEDVLEARGIPFEKIDISDPNNEEKKTFMRENSKSESGKTPLPPQLFYEEEYLGDYDKFLEALEDERIDAFLKQAPRPGVSSGGGNEEEEEEVIKEDEEKLKADEGEKESPEKDITIEEAAEQDAKKAENGAEKEDKASEKAEEKKEDDKKEEAKEEKKEDSKDVTKADSPEPAADKPLVFKRKTSFEEVDEDADPWADIGGNEKKEEEVKAPEEEEKDKPLVFRRKKSYDEVDEDADPWADIGGGDNEKKTEEIKDQNKDETDSKKEDDSSKQEDDASKKEDKDTKKEDDGIDLKKPLLFKRQKDYDEDEEADPWADLGGGDDDKKDSEEKEEGKG